MHKFVSHSLTVVMLTLGVATSLWAAEPVEVLDLWPNKAPSETGDIGPETIQDERPGDTNPVVRGLNPPRGT